LHPEAQDEDCVIPPLVGVRDLISQLDGLAGARPFLPPLVIAVTSEDGSVSARQFLAGFHDRLSSDRAGALVPHAIGAGPVLAAVAAGPEPDVALIEHIAGQLSTTMPTGAGRWRLLAFETCRDVLAADVGAGLMVDRRRRLRDHLFDGWESRNAWLTWARRMAAAASVPGKVLQVLVTAFFLGPNRWWFGRRLNGRRWRWLGEHVIRVTGLHGDFLGHALSLTGAGALRENAPLRRRVLVDALVRDIERLMRHRRFLPRRRRRRWLPVLSLDCTGQEGLACLDVLQSFVDVTEGKQVCPLLVVAAVDRSAIESVAGSPEPTAAAADRLQSYTDRAPSALPNPPWLPVLLQAEPEDRAVADWLGAHRKVSPRVPGTASAWAPVAVSLVVALTVCAGATYRYLQRGCAQTWSNNLGERVGLTDGSCHLVPGSQHAEGYPDLSALEDRIVANNTAVDEMRDRNGVPRDYRRVAFFAPLTRPANVVGRTVPANALWQLEGAVEAQQEINESARRDSGQVPIKLLLANSGDQFHDGPAVAEVLGKQPRTGPGSLAAVIGIAQSRPRALQAIDALRDLPVIGASVHGNDMTQGESKNFFMVAPTDDAVAQRLAAYLKQQAFQHAVIVYDPTDTYFSKDLHDSLQRRLAGAGVLPEPDQDISDVSGITLTENGDSTYPSRDLARRLCTGFTEHKIVPVLADRADEINEILAQADNVPECAPPHHITMVAGPGAIVEVASGEAAKYRRWLRLAYSAMAGTAMGSDKATGHDALLAASTAINQAAVANGGGDETSKGVLFQLRQPGFTIEGQTGKLVFDGGRRYDSSPDRVQILTVP
jgi:hypothetical protein